MLYLLAVFTDNTPLNLPAVSSKASGGFFLPVFSTNHPRKISRYAPKSPNISHIITYQASNLYRIIALSLRCILPFKLKKTSFLSHCDTNIKLTSSRINIKYIYSQLIIQIISRHLLNIYAKKPNADASSRSCRIAQQILR